MARPGTNGQELNSPDQIDALGSAFWGSRVLLTAYELGVFTKIAEGAVTAPAVAERAAADARATERLMNALCALGLLVKEDGVYRNSEAAARCLVEGGDEYLSTLGHTATLFARWATLTEAVKAGTSVVPAKVTDDGEEREAFIEAMHRRALNKADALIALIDLEGVSRVLDVGGGSGVYAMAFCRAREGLSAVVLDLPEVTPLTRRYVEADGYADRIGTVDGDYLECDFGSGFDLVFFSAIVHSNSADENRTLVDKAFAALDPGGRIAIQDFVMDETRTRPGMGALFALNMLVNTRAGDSFTEGEIRDWLEKAGCQDIERIGTGPFTAMLVGHKPAG